MTSCSLHLLTLFIVAASAVCPAFGQAHHELPRADTTYLDTKEGRLLQEFLTAYNSTDRAALERFAATYYTDDYVAANRSRRRITMRCS